MHHKIFQQIYIVKSEKQYKLLPASKVEEGESKVPVKKKEVFWKIKLGTQVKKLNFKALNNIWESNLDFKRF